MVRRNDFFQKCCASLPKRYETNVFCFFSNLRDAFDRKVDVTEEFLLATIRKSCPESPQIRFLHSSPITTPNAKAANSTPQRKLEEKFQELNRIKVAFANMKDDQSSMEDELKEKTERIDCLGELRIDIELNI